MLKPHRLIIWTLLLVVVIIIVDALPMLWRSYQQERELDFNPFSNSFLHSDNQAADPLKAAIRRRMACNIGGAFTPAVCQMEYRATVKDIFQESYRLNSETAIFYSALDRCPAVFRHCLRKDQNLDECLQAEKGCILNVRDLFWLKIAQAETSPEPESK